MSIRYHYDISPDALYHAAEGKTPEDFFVNWTPADLSRDDMVCAELCRLAYGDKDLVRFTLPRAGMKLVTWMGGESLPDRYLSWGTDGFVARGANKVFVVFRGTEPGKAEDIIADLRIKCTQWDNGSLVHEGFNAGYQAIRTQLQETLKNTTGELIFTGHSLGAAIATLAAADHLPRKPTLTTFGSPRVGDKTFVSQLDGHVTPHRYVDCCDVVARVPPEKIDEEHLDDLLSSFLWASARVGWVETILAETAKTLADHPEYQHFGDPQYIDRSGVIKSGCTTAEISDDQEAARAAYPPKSQLNTDEAANEGMLAGLYTAIKSHLGIERVPFRDLADHTPLNYLSAFTGRH